jgi:hypothetical protein
MQMSPSVPFLKKPANLDESLPGYVGFDPLGLATIGDVKFLQEAEIKHCRVSMLAVLGTVVQDLVTDPGYAKFVGGAKLTAAHDKIVAQVISLHDSHNWLKLSMLLTSLLSGRHGPDSPVGFLR